MLLAQVISHLVLSTEAVVALAIAPENRAVVKVRLGAMTADIMTLQVRPAFGTDVAVWLPAMEFAIVLEVCHVVFS